MNSRRELGLKPARDPTQVLQDRKGRDITRGSTVLFQRWGADAYGEVLKVGSARVYVEWQSGSGRRRVTMLLPWECEVL